MIQQNNNWLNIQKLDKFYEILDKLRLTDYITKIEIVSLSMKDSFSFGIDRWRDQSNSVISDYLPMSYDDTNDNKESNMNDAFHESPIKQHQIENYFQEINAIIRYNSDETYFTFLELPEIPSIDNNKMIATYIESLHILTQNLPPTALVKCGQQIPVISTNI